jgi:hypothetical protein
VAPTSPWRSGSLLTAGSPSCRSRPAGRDLFLRLSLP